ncbi:MAG: ATPase domain-containing protein, partial [Salinigranum sp.]
MTDDTDRPTDGSTATDRAAATDRVSTGIAGLDEILHGGLIPERSYMIRGEPGTGKTLTGLHYLDCGVENGETVLYVNLEESVADIRRNAAALGLEVAGFEFLDLSPSSQAFVENRTYDVFEASEVEASPFTEAIIDRVRDLSPDRVFIDPITRMRYLTHDEYQFRKQVLSFTTFLEGEGATVMFTTQNTASATDEDLQFLCDGTVELRNTETGRTVSVPKFRGSATRSGRNAMRISASGVEVFPALSPEAHGRTVGDEGRTVGDEVVSSGVPEIDQLLDGGVDRLPDPLAGLVPDRDDVEVEHAAVTIISGPTGVGKTTLGSQFTKEAAARGERSSIFLFEEAKETFLRRSEAIDVPIGEMLDGGTLTVT